MARGETVNVLLDIARGAAVVNVLLLLVLVYVWGKNYRRHRADHTLGLLIFAVFLVFQNGLWILLYGFDSGFIDWFFRSDLDRQIAITGLCGVQTIALLFLVRVTWR